MAYSADLRNKALNYYEQCKNISQTAATFNLSRNTLYLWIRLKKQTGRDLCKIPQNPLNSHQDI